MSRYGSGLLDRLVSVVVVLVMSAFALRVAVDVVRPVLPVLAGVVLVGLGVLLLVRFLGRRQEW